MVKWELPGVGPSTETTIELKGLSEANIVKLSSPPEHLQHPQKCLMKKEAGTFDEFQPLGISGPWN